MPSDQKRLESWKEIATYLKREVRTARRWEKERGLPVYRIPGKRSGVYALATEIDAWLKTRAPNGSGGDGAVEAPPLPPRSGARKLTPWVAAASVLLLAIAVLSGLPAARSAAPRLSHPVTITNDGEMKAGLWDGGRSLFFVSLPYEHETLKRISEGGGEASIIPFPSNTFGLLDVSRDGSQALAGLVDWGGCQWPLWAVPTTGGSPKKLADLCAGTAAWSPDGGRLAFAAGKNLFLSNADGKSSRQFVALPFDKPHEMRWSPDGRRLSLVLEEGRADQPFDRLWEVNVSTAAVRRVLPGWSRTPSDHEFGGEWTPDGRFFVFTAIHEGTSAIWAVRGTSGLLEWRNSAPIQLAASAEQVRSVALSGDGKKVFANVALPRRDEVVRFEPGVGWFLPYTPMSGISAGQLAFSPDGKTVAYVKYPEMSVWKANADGSNRLPVTSGSLNDALPHWSPDGQRIAFMGWDKPNGLTKIRVVSAAGGQPEEPVQWPGWQGAPNWAAGGTELIFGENGPHFPIPASCSLHVFNFRSGKTTDLPATTGLWTARTCPTGRYVAAMTPDNRTLVLYDRRTTARTNLLISAEAQLGDNPTWSADGRFVYMDVPFSRDPAVYRIRVADKRIERVAGLSGVRRTSWAIGAWIGLTPDGSLLTLRELQGTEIYAWDLAEP